VATAGGFDSLWGEEWRMTIERVWRWRIASARPRFPSDDVPEDEYEPASGPAKGHSLRFSGDGDEVELRPEAGELPVSTKPTVRGKRQGPAAGVLRYTLTDGLFAGGRFVVRRGETSFEAELTVYGSGIAIVASQRGHLSRR
jgi:hypothetical protein